MTSTGNVCQHEDRIGHGCIAKQYVVCPHCQLHVCLKHLNAHQDDLRSSLTLLHDDIVRTRIHLSQLEFDADHHSVSLSKQLDDWYESQVLALREMYMTRQQQLRILVLKSYLEFDVYKAKKEKQLEENLVQQWHQVAREEQIHVEELVEMQLKLGAVQKDLAEFQQLNIQVDLRPISVVATITQATRSDLAWVSRTARVISRSKCKARKGRTFISGIAEQ